MGQYQLELLSQRLVLVISLLQAICNICDSEKADEFRLRLRCGSQPL